MGECGFLPGVEQAQTDGPALVDQSRPGSGAVVRRHFHRQFAIVPIRGPVTVEACTLAIHEAPLRPLTQLGLQRLEATPGSQNLAVCARYPQQEAEVLRDRLFAEVSDGNLQAAQALQLGGAGLQQRLAGPRLKRFLQGFGEGRHRGQRTPQRLRQLADQGDQLVAQQPWHEPLQAPGFQGVQKLERHREHHAVIRVPRLEAVFERKAPACAFELIGKQFLRRGTGVLAHQHVMTKVKQPALLAAQSPKPLLEAAAAVDLWRDAGIEKLEKGMLVGEHVALASLVLERLHLRPDPFVVFAEGGACVQFPADQRFANEDPPRFRRLVRSEANAPFLHQHQPVQ